MKKALVFIGFIVFVAAQTAYAQPLFSYDPYPAMSRINPEAAPLVLSLVKEVVNPSKKCILQGHKEIVEGVFQYFIVIDYKNQRLSIYYQDSRVFLEGCNSYLAIYTRPKGTTCRDSLQIFRDDHLNGSWDRGLVNGHEIDGEFLAGSIDYEKYQTDFEGILKLGNDYFDH